MYVIQEAELELIMHVCFVFLKHATFDLSNLKVLLKNSIRVQQVSMARLCNISRHADFSSSLLSL